MKATTLGCLSTRPPQIVEAEISQLCPKDLDVFSLWRIKLLGASWWLFSFVNEISDLIVC